MLNKVEVRCSKFIDASIYDSLSIIANRFSNNHYDLDFGYFDISNFDDLDSNRIDFNGRVSGMTISSTCSAKCLLTGLGKILADIEFQLNEWSKMLR